MIELSVKEWPLNQRPRERLLKYGASVLSDADLLAAFIGSGTREHNTIVMARLLLSKFGSLRGILHASYKEICSTPGFGNARYATMHAVLEMVRRSMLETLSNQGEASNPKVVREYLSLKMRDYEHEMFACLFLNNQHQIIEFEELFRGTIDKAAVHPREVVKRALHHNAAAVILVHNHPSGNSEPSETDKEITGELQKALHLVDVRVLDHFVIGETTSSFAELDLL